MTLKHLPRFLLVLAVAGAVGAALFEIVGVQRIRYENELWRFRRDEAFGAGAEDRGQRRALAHVALAPPAMRAEHTASLRTLIDAMAAARAHARDGDTVVFRFEMARVPSSKSQVLLAARTLHYPLRFEPEITLRKGLQDGSMAIDDSLWVLDLRPEMPIEAAEFWTVVAQGKKERWRLLHLKDEAR